MYNLDFGKNFYGARLTFAKVDVKEKVEASEGGKVERFDHLDISLNEWRGKSDLPFIEFRF